MRSEESARVPTSVPQIDLAALLRRLDELESRAGELESDLAYAQRLATLGLFAGAVAHEVNGVLTPALARAQLALQDGQGGAAAPLETLIAAAQRATRISFSILGYLSDRQDAVCDVRSAVEEALDCMGRPPEKDGVELLVTAPDDCVAAIEPSALQQVLMNLIRNAVRAAQAAQKSRGDKGMLFVQAARSTWNRPHCPSIEAVRIVVQDNGPGIPRPILDRLFDPFTTRRLPRLSANADDAGGLGLGLAICRRLVEAAGGQIEAASLADGGARLTVWLPAANPVAPAVAASA